MADTVVPEFLTCPPDQNLRTNFDMTPVTWDEPTYKEIPGDEVRLICNYGSNSVLLPWGINNVIYTATNMNNGLSEICDFYVNIERKHVSLRVLGHLPPGHPPPGHPPRITTPFPLPPRTTTP